MQNNYFLGFVLVVISGLVWSLAAPLIRFLEDAEHYRLPFLVYRGTTICLVVIAYVLLREGIAIYKLLHLPINELKER